MKKIFGYLLVAVMLFILPFDICAECFIKCGKISDYTFEDGKSNVIVANRNASKQVALTFDDGPSNNLTSEILDILSSYGIKGTFFVVGKNAEKYPEILRRSYAEGHEIGNHTFSHPDMRKITPEELDKEIGKTQAIIKEITGKEPTLFRPPGGYLSNNIVDKITSNNCKTVLWSWRQDTFDWKCPKASVVIDTVISNINDGDIILFHDYNTGVSPTPEALKVIIPELLSKGYEFVTVSELVNIR